MNILQSKKEEVAQSEQHKLKSRERIEKYRTESGNKAELLIKDASRKKESYLKRETDMLFDDQENQQQKERERERKYRSLFGHDSGTKRKDAARKQEISLKKKTDLSLTELENQRLKERERIRRYRSASNNMSEEKRKDADRKKESRLKRKADISIIELENQQRNERERKRRYRSASGIMSEEKRKDAARKKESRLKKNADISIIELENQQRNERERKRKYRSASGIMSEEKRKDAARKKESRLKKNADISIIELENQQRNERERKRKYRSASGIMSEGKRKDAARKKESRLKKNADISIIELENQQRNERERKRQYRSASGIMSEGKRKDAARKKESRLKKNADISIIELENQQRNERERKRKYRSASGIMSEGKRKDAARKKESRLKKNADISIIELENQQRNERERKRKYRSASGIMSEGKRKDAARKKESRLKKNADISIIELENQQRNERERKRRYRSASDNVSEAKRKDVARKKEERMKKQTRLSFADRKEHLKVDASKRKEGRRKKQAEMSAAENQNLHAEDSRRKKLARKDFGKSSINNLHELFKTKISEGPVYVCTCCKRLLYRHAVLHCHPGRYKNLDDGLLSSCITGYKSVKNEEWICNTCDGSLKKNKMPCQAEANMLYLEKIPPELDRLCSLEARLISLRLPFMQIVNLPRGSQKGIRGSVVNVPSDISSVIDKLPRLPDMSGLIPIKLKRKLCYKSHVMYQSVRPSHVMEALTHLKQNNHFYDEVDVDNDWMMSAALNDIELTNALIESTDFDELSTESEETDDDSEMLESDTNNTPETEDGFNKLRGVCFDTCMQPTDLAEDSNILSIAPGEGQKPLSMLMDLDCESLAFPKEFPTGKFGISAERLVKLHNKRYFNQRILNVDSRFAKNIEYLFFAQYHTEVSQISGNISTAIRQRRKGKQNYKAGEVNNISIDNIIKENNGYRFLQTVRGSYPYWSKTLLDLFAMVKQLGIPTWFVTLSAADLKWTETIKIIAQQYGHTLTESDILEMDWQEKCFWLRNNPVTASRHFDFRVQKFLHDILLSDVAPIGKIEDYFLRVEFQQRGSPHLHCLFWVKDAPQIDSNSDQDICTFVDKYVSCNLPENDPELCELVNTVQRHAHSGTCHKSSKVCRFRFPRPPCATTMVTEKDVSDSEDAASKNITDILSAMQEHVLKENDESLSELLKKICVDEKTYHEALKQSTNKPSILLRRQPSECFINNYNPDLLRIWKANMDIQFVIDPWACAMYILSYISKGERQMGQLLKQASKECEENTTLRTQMKKIGNVFLTHREVGAQEAVYRIFSIPLKRSSREILFLNSSMPEDRVRILKSVKKLQEMDPDSEDIFENNIFDRYCARPECLEEICLADFASLYHSRSQTTNNDSESVELGVLTDDGTTKDEEDKKLKKLKLLNNKGTIIRRRRRVILRTPKFSKYKNAEKFFHSQLILYLPWRSEQELLGQSETYEEKYYEHEDQIEQNRRPFENVPVDLEDAANTLEEGLDIWDDLEKIKNKDDDEMNDMETPELDVDVDTDKEHKSSTDVVGFSCELQKYIISEHEQSLLIQSLNEEQRSVFDFVLSWCRRKVQSRTTFQHPDPFHIFLTGGAGTGKSHLIRAIVNCARKELQCLCEAADEITTLISAPTGCAAANIDGCTIHSAFCVPVKQYKSDYEALSHNRLSALQLLYRNLKILIIDEISMVGYPLLYMIHRRLNQIMGCTRSDVYFGGVSILSVGDFHQLFPVKQQPVFSLPPKGYVRLNPVHLWKDLFHVFELRKIMRQRDEEFALLLNRVRIGKINAKDISTLKSRCITTKDKKYPIQALHVFPFNKEVDSHNIKMISSLKDPIRYLHAKDHSKGKKIVGNVTNILPDNPNKTGGLRKLLPLTHGTRVMLIRNICTDDGLVNGAQGVVHGFLGETTNQTSAVLVKFFDLKVGKNQRKKYQLKDPSLTPIERIDITFTVKKYKTGEVTRSQFPLALAFACTIHKVQGLTLDQIVISFGRTFKAGQAYVALSRATRLNGLFLTNFDAKKIVCSTPVLSEMERLKADHKLLNLTAVSSFIGNDILKVFHLNVRSLPKHIEDLKHHDQILDFDVICLSETWLHEHYKESQFDLSGFNLYRLDRHKTFKNHLCKEMCEKCNNCGGVCVFIKKKIKCSDVSFTNIEMMSVTIQHMTLGNIKIIVAYRPNHVCVVDFNVSLSKITDPKLPEKVILTGDFNMNSLTQENKNALTNYLDDEGFKKVTDFPTHVSGSSLDQIYINGALSSLASGLIPVYYSDHDGLFVIISSPENKSSIPNNVDHINSNSSSSPKRLQATSSSRKASRKILKKKSANNQQSTIQAKASTSSAITVTGYTPPSIVVNDLITTAYEDKQLIAAFFGVSLKNDSFVNAELYDSRYTTILRHLQQSTKNVKIDMIDGDGNCFFRAVTKELLGSEIYHFKFRTVLCNFIEAHPLTFSTWMMDDVDIYDHVREMKKNRKWATEIEIIATSTFFKTSIYQFTNQYTQQNNTGWNWIEVPPTDIHPGDAPYTGIPITGNIYLHHTWGKHFDRICST